jgi:hypothetical protein
LADIQESAQALTERPAYSLGALAFATIFAISIPVAAWVYGWQRPAVDFVSFWAAGQLAISGHPALAYDIEIHRALERTVTTLGGLMPFPYPPPFLLFVALLGLLPFWVAYLPWILATTAIYLAATRSFVSPRFALAHPAALVNSIIGQNGLLTSGIFLGGLLLLEKRPLVAGLILGLLVIKPQLAVLLPVAVIAARNWKAMAGGVISSVFLLAVAAAVFGLDSYRAFFAITQQYGVYLSTYRWHWGEQASVFAFLRFFGVERSVAFAFQGIAALAAGLLTWKAWSRAVPERFSILAAATILVPPYLFAYDSLILMLPLARLLQKPDHSWRPAIVWSLLVVPMFGYVDVYPGPNTIPIASVLCLWWLYPPKEPATA